MLYFFSLKGNDVARKCANQYVKYVKNLWDQIKISLVNSKKHTQNKLKEFETSVNFLNQK